ncbi:MAG: hypothetical protein PUK40_03425 [Actinomycetaceae bacterium]|nr:hypothetical protein [Arcanobacterium sp.]MDD7504991.1 hypothetical protein [Actinomycetaceae bacterium]MDY6143352.1 hypothetical protein [Arcanobacterium sp.]
MAELERRAAEDAHVSQWEPDELTREICIFATAHRHRVIAKTLAGGAKRLAAYLDESHAPGVLGSIAGDDVVISICSSPELARRVASKLTDTPGE